MESKRQCESDNEAKECCVVMTLHKIILGKLLCGMNATALGRHSLVTLF
jgi:hypothetical protein